MKNLDFVKQIVEIFNSFYFFWFQVFAYGSEYNFRKLTNIIIKVFHDFLCFWKCLTLKNKKKKAAAGIIENYSFRNQGRSSKTFVLSWSDRDLNFIIKAFLLLEKNIHKATIDWAQIF